MLWGFLPYAIVSIVHIGALALHSDLAAPTKLLLMPLLVLAVLLSSASHPRPALVLLSAALLFSWLGDSAGSLFPGVPDLPLMLGFFGIAHLAYIGLFLGFLKRRRIPWWAVVYALWWVGMLVVLGPRIGALLLAVAAYGLVLGGTAVSASRCHPLVAWGGVFFLSSDTLLAFRLFLPDAMPDRTSPAVMLTYTLGQGLIIAGALQSLRAEETRS